MEIKFSDAQPPSPLTFEDVPVGFTFSWLTGGGPILKLSERGVFGLLANDFCYVTDHLKSRVKDVAEIESITLRRVK